MNRAIITDVHYRMSLAAVRSLGRRGIPVTAVEFDNVPVSSVLGFYSKYSSENRTLPNAALQPQDFIRELITLATEQSSIPGQLPERELPVLIPAGLDTLLTVCRHREYLESYLNICTPPYESIEIANDTAKLLSVALHEGIPCPETTTLQENESIEELSKRIVYPVVIKYRKGEALRFKPEKRYKIIRDVSDFIHIYHEMHTNQSYPLVQRYISGSGFGVSAVFDKRSEPLEIFCHKRIREYPATGGPSCFCESIWDHRLVDYAVRLLKALKWQGIAMVEFKGDLAGELGLMEINPRFWGSLPLSILSGCDMPYALYRAAMGETSSCPDCFSLWQDNKYKLGKQMRFLFQDLLSVPGYLRLHKNKLSFLLRFAADLLNPSVSDGILEWKDWKPSIKYILQAAKKR